MRSLGQWTPAVFVALLVFAAAPALAQTFNSGSTGVDGVFNPTSDVTVPLPPDGVFNYTTVTIPAGVTVRYTRTTANAPVTILASGNVTIAGTIEISGANGTNGAAATGLSQSGGAGGAGGFDGGNASNGIVVTTGGSGLGPGGGGGGAGFPGPGAGAGFATAGGGASGGGPGTPGVAYGTASLLPLIGGSGGGGGSAGLGTTGGGGGGGGGAIVIASSQTITLTGSILSRGGNGGTFSPAVPGPGAGAGGSGGAVRLVASTLTGTGGTVNVTGGGGGSNNVLNLSNFGGGGSVGRVRLEALTNTLTANFAGVSPSVAPPTSVALPNAPTLRITAVGGVPAPATPGASFGNPDVVLPAATSNPVTVDVAGTNIPSGTAVVVTLTRQRGGSTSGATTLSGTPASTTGSVAVTIPTNQPSVISASASFLLIVSNGGPVFVEGEEVERVRITAEYGASARVAYITKSGRELVMRRP